MRSSAGTRLTLTRLRAERLDFKLSALPPDIRDEARARVDEITHLLVEKLLLTPTEQLKSLADPETATMYAEAITRVFGLPESPEKEPETRADNRVEPFSRAKRSGPSGRQR